MTNEKKFLDINNKTFFKNVEEVNKSIEFLNQAMN